MMVGWWSASTELMEQEYLLVMARVLIQKNENTLKLQKQHAQDIVKW